MRRLVLIALFVLALLGSAAAQQLSAAAAGVLADASSHAAVVFVGHVTAVSRQDAAGYVDVTFRIDQPVRGCPRTGTYVLREWAGLWSGRGPRYTVGERRLMLLTARSASGLSAPVHAVAMLGAIPLRAAGRAALAGGEPDAGAPAELQADLSALEAQAVRPFAAAGSAELPGSIAPLRRSAGATASLTQVLTALGSGGTGGSVGGQHVAH